MGDLNQISPLDKSRYNEAELCLKYPSDIKFCSPKGTPAAVDWRPMQILLDAGLIDTSFLFSGLDVPFTFPSVSPIWRLDYILVNKLFLEKFKNFRAGTITEAGDKMSDHFPVFFNTSS